MKRFLAYALAVCLLLGVLPMAFASTWERYDERYQLNPNFPGTYLGKNGDGVHTFEITITDDGTRYPLPLTYMGEQISPLTKNDGSSYNILFMVDPNDGFQFFGVRPGSGTLIYRNVDSGVTVDIAIIRITVVSKSGITTNPGTTPANPGTAAINPDTVPTNPSPAPTASPSPAPTANPGTAATRPSTASGETPSGGKEYPKLSKDEICDLLGGSASAHLSTDDLYDVAPNCSAPYSIGMVKQSVLQEAVDRLNALRRIAGVPQVTLDAKLCEQGQYGAVLLGTLSSISHTPSKPADMTDSFYQIAKQACNDSNISSSWDLLWTVDSMMDDSDSFNYKILGHRRWQLNPTMGKIGFGVVKDGKKTVIGGSSAGSGLTYTASATVEMAHDRSGAGCDYDYISWPASGNFPIGEYFHPAGSMWSITLNPEKYTAPNKYLVKIKIVRENDGQEWYIDKDSNAKDQSYYFNVDTTVYGVRNCIIFHPSNYVGDYGSSLDGESYTVTVSGLFLKDGTPTDLVYSVNFFNPATYRSSTASTAPTTPAAPDPKPTTSEEPSATGEPSTIEKPVTSEKPSEEPSISEKPTAPTQPTTYNFADVSSSAYYAKPVTWAVGQGITVGTSTTTFSPDEPCTTAHILTFLWRAAGRPGAASTDMAWDDELVVVADWAKSKGITVPNDLHTVCTRASAVNYMWKAVGSPAPRAATTFTDIPASANYSRAVSWALEQGVTDGTSPATFSPGDGCTRGQIVTFLYRQYVEPLP